MPTTNNPDSSRPPRGTLLIIGASARQYAQSAGCAGIVCTTVDLFSDWDLQEFADSYVVKSLNDFNASRFFESFSELPDQFVICGGMEKRPQLISEISRHVPYVGTCPKQIERLNDPFDIAGRCAANRILFPQVCLSGNLPRETGSDWLLKPCRSAGGAGISFWRMKSLPSNGSDPHCFANVLPPLGIDSDSKSDLEPLHLPRVFYHQQFVDGQSYSSLFCSDARTSNLIGSTIQLVGLEPFSNRRFSYCGSIGPIDVGCECQRELERIGNVLAREFQLVGIFGIDWVLDAAGKIWLIEINPRMTASAEIFDLAGCLPSITKLHLESAAGVGQFKLMNANSFYGKAILYSDMTETLVVNESVFGYFQGMDPLNGRRGIADIPRIGSRIGPGEPILTLFASANSESETLSGLRSKAETIRLKMDKLDTQVTSS